MTDTSSPQINTTKQLLNRSVELYGDRVAIHLPHADTDTPSTITYMQLGSDVQALGTALLLNGLKGKRIAIIGKNSYEWGLTYLAVMNGVGIAVSLDKELSTKELIDSIERVGIDAIFYSEDVKQKVDAASKKTKNVVRIAMAHRRRTLNIPDLLLEGKQHVQDGDKTYEKMRIDPDAMAALLFTSGTTSRSKIVMLSHKNIISDMINGVRPFRLSPHDKFLSVLPMHHMFECNAGFLAVLYSGCSIYFSQGIRYIAQEFKDQRPTVVICVPRIIDALSANIWKGIRLKRKTNTVRRLVVVTNLLDSLGIRIKHSIFKQIHDELGGSIRFFLSGAAPVNQQTAKSMINLGFTIFQGYGLTECSPAVALTNYESNDIDSVGPPIAGTKIKILNPDDHGVGEVLVKGPHVMLGYYDDPIATKQTMHGDYFRTGDLGLIKLSGNLKIIGRKKNVIVTSGGKKIYPEEIESLLLVSPAIKDAVIHAVNTKHGQKISVSVVLNDSSSKTERLRLEKLAHAYIATVNNDLAPYEQIQVTRIRQTDFARTSTLKVKRHLLDE